MNWTGKVAAGVVAFYPDTRQLTRLVHTLSADVERVYVFCNSWISPTLRSTLETHAQITLIEAARNIGIGAGLNGIVSAAASGGFSDVALFDQDSRPEPGMIGRIFAIRMALLASGQRPAVVAPMLVTEPDRISESKAPIYRSRAGLPPISEARAVAFVPTSGSLISLEAMHDVGLFRADYFIDGIDLEWSFRAWSRGWSCWIASGLPMVHSIGTGVISLPIVGFAMPRQRPFRMYCTVRNTLYGLRLKHIPLGWKLRQVAYLPVQMVAYALHHRLRPAIIAQLAAGTRDGIMGRLGTPPAAPDGREAQEASTPLLSR